MDLQELGALLRQERERKGLSLNDIVQATKISRRNIEALEWGREDELPHLVYAKGFLKNYAKLLGLNPDKMANALTQAYVQGCEDEEDVDLSAYRPGSCRGADSATVANGFGVAKLGLSATIILLLGGMGVVGYLAVDGRIEVPFVSRLMEVTGLASSLPQTVVQPLGSDGERTSRAGPAGGSPESSAPASSPSQGHAPVQPPKPAEKAALPAAVTSDLPRPDQTPAAPTIASALPPDQAAGRSGEETAARKPEKIALPTAAPSQDAAAPAAREAPAADAQGVGAEVAPADRIMIVEATEQCWVNAYVDGSKKKQTYVLKPGQSVQVGYKKSLKLRLGNAGGVNLTHNGQALGAPGRAGEVMSLRYQ